MTEKDIAGVIAPPPLIYIVSILVGVGLNYFAPVSLVPTSLSGWLGPTSIGLGLTLMAFCFITFHKAKTNPRPDRPTIAIVCGGPYRFSRNPMYIAGGLIQIGVAIWANILWIAVMLLPAYIVVSYGVIAREERYLETKFGEVYLSYRASVRRWF